MKHRLNGFLYENVDTFGQYFIQSPDCIEDATEHYYNSAPISILYTNDDLWAQLNYTALKVRGRRGRGIRVEEREVIVCVC